ncbi:MAG TPA: S1C family serine protease, partial [Thermoguttaceae bacterium]|nr:S1C family serine protease [Thermoguttaceae bacterium]
MAACGLLAVWLAHCLGASALSAGSSVAETIAEVQPKMVKIYGAGGFRGMEAYQSGMLISDEGHIMTVFSYVLDTDYITVVLDDGRKFEAEL